MEARRAPALAALPGLRSEDLFVEGPPGARERAGRPSPTLADLVQSAPRRTLAALPRIALLNRPNCSRVLTPSPAGIKLLAAPRDRWSDDVRRWGRSPPCLISAAGADPKKLRDGFEAYAASQPKSHRLRSVRSTLRPGF